eukprot:Gb_31990 [translate_table: standard]
MFHMQYTWIQGTMPWADLKKRCTVATITYRPWLNMVSSLFRAFLGSSDRHKCHEQGHGQMSTAGSGIVLQDSMASKLQQLQGKATVASQFAMKHACAYYKQLLEQNKHYIQEPATVEKCSELSKRLFYTRLARLIWSIAIR